MLKGILYLMIAISFLLISYLSHDFGNRIATLEIKIELLELEVEYLQWKEMIKRDAEIRERYELNSIEWEKDVLRSLDSANVLNDGGVTVKEPSIYYWSTEDTFWIKTDIKLKDIND